MEKGKVLKVWETALLLALSITLCAGVWAQGRQESISSSLVRLHVLRVAQSPLRSLLRPIRA